MSRPTRTEIEEAISWDSTYAACLGECDGGRMPLRPLEVLVAAARLYARLAPDTCPNRNCEGGRVVTDHGYDCDDCAGHEERFGCFANCSTCGGRGYVWPEELARIWYCFVLDLGWQEGHETPGYDRVGLPDHCKQENHSECGWLVRLDALVEVDDDE